MAHKVPLITPNLWFPIGGPKQHHFAQLWSEKLLQKEPFDWLGTQGWAVGEIFSKKTEEARTLFLFFSCSWSPPLACPPWLSCPVAPSACWDLWNTPTSGIWSLVLSPIISFESKLSIFVFRKTWRLMLEPQIFYSWGCMDKLGHFGKVFCSFITRDILTGISPKH